MSDPTLLTVSQLTREIKSHLEDHFAQLWVVGEVSNCTRARSGHIYFTLKDESAQIRAIVWRRTAARLKFDVVDGLELLVAGSLEVYEARGSYQLIVEECVPQGVGELELAFRQLRDKLAAEGLFDPERKQPLPRFPRRIALVTSPTGAAVRDMLQVITRRWQAVDVIVIPVKVQGPGAAEQIARALRDVPRIPRVDVVIAGRGGGSLEDLWAFNEEVVARAIADCRLPVISAVGHEIDVTIADLVADRRALTPSEAAELVVPLHSEISEQLDRLRHRLTSGLKQRAATARIRLDGIATRRVLERPMERVDELSRRLDELEGRLNRAASRQVQTVRSRLDATGASLRALDPQRVLARGYSITQSNGKIITKAEQLSPGQDLTTYFAQGAAISRVRRVDNDQKVDQELISKQDN